ncbi:MAG TPA: type I 3-dehydroquinate dehydratase [Candidatus Hydrogenedentes bacterium]|nr:type I 3-dehydroquinate dehydratase [Candidatus Hydrogenedentota bacterium]
MVSIGTCVLGLNPRVALAVDDGCSREEVDAAMTAGADMLEFRIDRFQDTSRAYVLDVLGRFNGFPRIGTIRSSQEGGGWKGGEEARLDLFAAIMPHVEAVDIEIASSLINRQVVECAACQGKTIIGSFHDFHGTPGPEVFEAYIQQARDLGVTIIKFAAHCSTRAELCQLAGLLLNNTDKHLIVLGMGNEGRISRFLFPALGSLVTYTFLGTPSAPGQASLDETLHILDLLYERNK